ncbi:hypothetical protein GCM10010176_037410 [Nonomuraea spiralis]|nr:hypothetical protein GCM10010176_037410 [Nonomuraea spiralis]
MTEGHVLGGFAGDVETVRVVIGRLPIGHGSGAPDLLDGRVPLPDPAVLRRGTAADLDDDQVAAMIAAAFIRSW